MACTSWITVQPFRDTKKSVTIRFDPFSYTFQLPKTVISTTFFQTPPTYQTNPQYAEEVSISLGYFMGLLSSGVSMPGSIQYLF